MTQQKATAVACGRVAENMAVAYLEAQGYCMIKRNYYCAAGELDAVAWDGAVLCFIEIRARSTVDYGDPLETITPQKIKRIVRASSSFLQTWSSSWPDMMRFDALGVLLQQPPQYTLIRGAFEAF